MKKILIKYLLLLFYCFSLNVYAGTFGSDASGINVDFGAGRGTAVSGALSGLAGVKVSLYDTNSPGGVFLYSFAIISSNTKRPMHLVNTRKVNGEYLTVYSYNDFSSLRELWAGSDNGGFSYSSVNVKKALCGSAAGNACDATDAFYIMANTLINNTFNECQLYRDENRFLLLSNECQNKLSKYRIVLEPIYAFGLYNRWEFYTLKGIAAKGVNERVTSDPHYGMYIEHALANANASEIHGNIKGLPAYGNLYDKYLKLSSPDSGYGYNIFYLNPNQTVTPPPSGEITYPTKDLYEKNDAVEKLQCDNSINSLYYTSEYSYEENSSIQKDNPYCNVICETNISIDYPNVFSVTPAGQNFELIYEPTINAKKTCHADFDYDNWRTNYNKAIENEKMAVQEYNAAVAEKESADSINATPIGECGDCYDVGEGENQTTICPDTEYELTADNKRYKTLGSVYSEASTGNIILKYASKKTYCDTNGSVTNYINNTYKNPVESRLAAAKNDLKKKVQDRLNLEKYNLQCYTSLDSANESEDIKNSDIFSEGYNTYKDINNVPYTNDISIKTNIERLSSISAGTGDDYNNYIPNTNVVLTEGIITRKSTKDFFTFEPELKFVYQNGMDRSGNKTLSDEEIMLVEAQIIQDTGPFTFQSDKKEVETESIGSHIYYTFGKTELLHFNAYKMTSISRVVEYSYKFHEGTEYCGNLKGGDFVNCKSLLGNNSNYKSLSTLSEYTDKSNVFRYFYNHNYPVKLNAGADFYQVDFTLTKNGTLEKVNDFNGKFTCDYQVTNDLFDPATKSLDVLFRSVSTINLDPNNRFATNKFGKNWIDEKGLAVKKLIEKNADDSLNSTTKNTYNPDNLEYSFTLTPSLINAIQDYNETNNYSEYDIECNEAGMQCKSTFLTSLAEGSVDGNYVQSDYPNVNSFNLSDARDEWKYYLVNGELMPGCVKIRSDVDNMYACPYDTIETTSAYNELYQINGVLP